MATTPRIVFDGGSVSFSDKFEYPGSIINSHLKDEAECNAHISAASKAFGSLKKQFFSVTGIQTRAKAHAHKALVLSLLFYGIECWVLSENMKGKIRLFRRRHIRYMCGITITSIEPLEVHHVDLECTLEIAGMFGIGIGIGLLIFLGIRSPTCLYPHRSVLCYRSCVSCVVPSSLGSSSVIRSSYSHQASARGGL